MSLNSYFQHLVRQRWLMLLAGAVFWPGLAFSQGGPALVEVRPVVQQDVAAGQTFVGTVTPTQTAVVGSAVDGRVIDVPAREGDRVEEGGTLAQLLTDTILLELQAARAELDLRQQEYNELKNGSRPDEIEEARARMQAAEVSSNYLKAEQERITDLASRSAAAAREMDKAISDARSSEQLLAEAQAAYRLAVDGPRPERIAQAAAQVAMQQALVEQLEDREKKHTIISRFKGYVIAEHTEVGQWVSKGDPVAEVIAVDQVDVVVSVLESHLPFVRLNQTVRVEIPALPRSVFTGTVKAIVQQADIRTRTFPVKIRVDNVIDEAGQPLLNSGMMARAVLPTGASQQGLLVPKDALVLGGRSTALWVIDSSTIKSTENGARQAEAKMVPVELGVAQGDRIQVLGNLHAGDLVVVKGNERIIPRPNQPSLVTWSPVSAAEGEGADAAH